MSIGIATLGMFSPQIIEYHEVNYGGSSYFSEKKRKPIVRVDKVIQEDIKNIHIDISEIND